MAKSDNFVIKKWVEEHAKHKFFLTASGLPYPKPVNYRTRDRELRPAFALYALMVALEGKAICRLPQAIEQLSTSSTTDTAYAGELREPLEKAIGKLGRKTTVDEVVRVLRRTAGQFLRQASMEVGWCYQRGWVRIEPVAKWDP